MKPNMVEVVLKQARVSLNPSIEEALNEAYGAARTIALNERKASTEVIVQPLRFTSTNIDFEVREELQQYK